MARDSVIDFFFGRVESARCRVGRRAPGGSLEQWRRTATEPQGAATQINSSACKRRNVSRIPHFFYRDTPLDTSCTRPPRAPSPPLSTPAHPSLLVDSMLLSCFRIRCSPKRRGIDKKRTDMPRLEEKSLQSPSARTRPGASTTLTNSQSRYARFMILWRMTR